MPNQPERENETKSGPWTSEGETRAGSTLLGKELPIGPVCCRAGARKVPPGYAPAQQLPWGWIDRNKST